MSITTNVKHRVRTTGSEHQGQNSISDPDQYCSDPDQNLGFTCIFSSGMQELSVTSLKYVTRGMAVHTKSCELTLWCIVFSGGFTGHCNWMGDMAWHVTGHHQFMGADNIEMLDETKNFQNNDLQTLKVSKLNYFNNKTCV